MQKKSAKKLRLERNIVRKLEVDQAAQVAGGLNSKVISACVTYCPTECQQW